MYVPEETERIKLRHHLFTFRYFINLKLCADLVLVAGAPATSLYVQVLD